ncbi:hypothetical protein MW290_08150 [Aquincola tertiaricarbonis]|uniref:MFS transporter permease n=1 Tax=Aquincola tertiaricarbonis TaxID=391953 RepID=A0ABY4S3H5_AQUTE|nr:hypothetical protein [Aquincola tertiaricarbonis]URI05915.1 hypothetical protein MW290_08150 [Aquincola tertiaricarbonis]
MSEWWTYRPSDFLMFAPRTYWRLFELHNTAWWPAPPWLVLAGGVVLALLWCQRKNVPAGWLRGMAALLALGWAFSGWAFVAQRYAPINWAAEGLALACAVPALVLAALALPDCPLQAAASARYRAGLLLLGWAVVGHPLLAPIFDRPLLQAEVWMLAPDPTAVATLGWLLAVQPGARHARWLCALAWTATVAWCAVSAATLWTMGSAQGWVVAGLAVAAVGTRVATQRAPGAPAAGSASP